MRQLDEQLCGGVRSVGLQHHHVLLGPLDAARRLVDRQGQRAREARMMTFDPVGQRAEGVGGVQTVGADDEGEVPARLHQVVQKAVEALQDVVVQLPIAARHRQGLVVARLVARVVPLEAVQVALEMGSEDGADGSGGEVPRGQAEGGALRGRPDQLPLQELVVGDLAGGRGGHGGLVRVPAPRALRLLAPRGARQEGVQCLLHGHVGDGVGHQDRVAQVHVQHQLLAPPAPVQARRPRDGLCNRGT